MAPSSVVLSKKQSMQLNQLVRVRPELPNLNQAVVSREDLIKISQALYGRDNCFAWLTRIAPKAGRGAYDITEVLAVQFDSYPASPVVAPQESSVVENSNSLVEASRGSKKVSSDEVLSEYVPLTDKNYVAHGNMKILEPIISSRLFYPVFITGLSGNGKTTMVQQVCANLKRELFRANITIETDEDDLIGGYRLINGDTVWQDGPVIEAMKRGAVLLLDEVDLASNKIMCLQSVLEGKSIFLKKLGRIVQPAEGFTVVATANTKGKGDAAGGFVGTNVLNEAFLDRFPITIYQDYPTQKQEVKILNLIRKSIGADTKDDFPEKLVSWAVGIRKSYEEGAASEIITTRRLVNIIQANSIFNDRKKSVALCIERFDDDTKKAFLDLYSAIDASVVEKQSDDEDVSSPAEKKSDEVLAW